MIAAPPSNPLARASEQQLETLRELRRAGWLYKRAAARLGVPEATVRTRIFRLLAATGLPDRAEAAYQLALLDAEKTAHSFVSVDMGA